MKKSTTLDGVSAGLSEPDAVYGGEPGGSAATTAASARPAASAQSRLRRGARSGGDAVGLARASVEELQQRITTMQSTTLQSKDIATIPALAAVLPGGSLKQGAAYSVDDSLTLTMALLVGPSQAGEWCGVVGVPDFGAEAAAAMGIDLERLVLVPHPGDDWLAVTAAMADVLTVVVTRPPGRASDGDVARLGARLRQRGAALVVLGEWPQCEARLRLRDHSWHGLGAGHGRLTARQATLDVTGRGGTAYRRGVRVWLGGVDGPVSEVAPAVDLSRARPRWHEAAV